MKHKIHLLVEIKHSILHVDLKASNKWKADINLIKPESSYCIRHDSNRVKIDRSGYFNL
jgi:hypothetical protein